MTTSRGHALGRDELIHVLTAFGGVTTADGAVGGLSIIDSNLIGKNDFLTGKALLLMSGDAIYEDKGILSFNTLTGEVVVGTAFMDVNGAPVQIPSGTIYRILNISSVEVDVSIIEARIGTNTDPSGKTTLFAWLSYLADQAQALAAAGVVTAIPGPQSFTIPTLAGLGAGKFVSATNPYSAFVVRDAAGLGAAPQGEMQVITAYNTLTGDFTTAAFTAPVDIADGILILHPAIAATLSSVFGLAVIESSVQTTVDGVYLDLVVGVAGTAWPIGSPGAPVSNIADALTILTARKLSKLYLVGSGGSLTFPSTKTLSHSDNGEFDIVIAPGASVVFTNNCLSKSLTNNGNLRIDGDAMTGAVINAGAGLLQVTGDLTCTTVTNPGAGTITVNGRLFATAVDNTGGVSFAVTGDALIDTTVVKVNGALFLGADLHCTSVANNGTGTIVIGANLFGTSAVVSTTAGGSVTVSGDSTSGAINAGAGSIIIFGSARVHAGNVSASTGSVSLGSLITESGGISLTGIGSISISGKAELHDGSLINSSTGTINIAGDTIIANGPTGTTGKITAAAGSIEIFNGNLEVIGLVTNAGTITVRLDAKIGSLDNTGGSLTVNGILRILGTIVAVGTLVYKGIYPEVPINITAILASETDVFHLALLAGYHYTVGNLRLKSADPGVNSVNVRLYQLINNVKTLLDTFTITTATFTTYFSLMDMFGVDHLSGDELQVTVQATAGGPYAVTASYSYRSV